jgi:hypothetical protein
MPRGREPGRATGWSLLCSGRGASNGADLADHGCDYGCREEATADAPMDG